jgi:hypothetical protein
MFTVMIVGIVLLLNLGGIITPTGDAIGLTKKLNLIDDNQNLTVQDVKSSEIWANESSTDSIKGIRFLFLFAVTAGIVIGAFGRTPDIRYITAAVVFYLGSFLLTDLIYIVTIINTTWIKTAVGLIVGGLTAGFIVTMIQFWQGTD